MHISIIFVSLSAFQVHPRICVSVCENVCIPSFLASRLASPVFGALAHFGSDATLFSVILHMV